MRIGVDLDGVLYEWSKTARFMLREYKGYDKDGPLGTESTDWDYVQRNVSPEDWDWLWTRGIDLGLFRYGHVVTGAQSGVRALRAQGHKVSVVTHRPAEAVPDTIAWLDLFQKPEAGVVFDGVHILTNGERKSSVVADVLIDDKASNLEDWIGHGRRGVLFKREWNQSSSVAGAIPANSWFEATKAIYLMTAQSDYREALDALAEQ